MSFVVNGVTIKSPSGFKVERYNVSTMDRLANAQMVGDLVAKKLKFYFTYDFITSQHLDAILSAIWDAPGLFFTLLYQYQGQTKSATVYVGSIPSELYRAQDNGQWVWQNVSFNLIER